MDNCAKSTKKDGTLLLPENRFEVLKRSTKVCFECMSGHVKRMYLDIFIYRGVTAGSKCKNCATLKTFQRFKDGS